MIQQNRDLIKVFRQSRVDGYIIAPAPGVSQRLYDISNSAEGEIKPIWRTVSLDYPENVKSCIKNDRITNNENIHNKVVMAAMKINKIEPI